MSRLAQLHQMLEESPQDAFLLYALATEYRALQENQKALQYYEQLLTLHPAYEATYYHLAHLYIELEAYDKATATFEAGIRVLREQKSEKLLKELQNAYLNFQMEQL
jgi:tetratricopeptide (TPR) repeat protein